ncbi:glycosyltransferase [Nocardia vinacea]|uniref:Glycosyltransferase n=1 Tax=Nocardia vinacea TaxID=96468 RepID=A0ABZ1YTK8_9NOCA|nr:glycosyltransferase [Nocardia vinacea]
MADTFVGSSGKRRLIWRLMLALTLLGGTSAVGVLLIGLLGIYPMSPLFVSAALFLLASFTVVGFLNKAGVTATVELQRRQLRRQTRKGQRAPTDACRSAQEFLPKLSVIVPAYNEAVGIEAAVRSFVTSDYPNVEMIVVDDGSTDGTATVVEQLGLPGVRLVRQSNAGKAAALQHGIALAAAEVLVLVDADTVFEPGTLRRLVQPLADPAVGAVAGNIKVGNRGGLLGRWQHLEYVLGHSLNRRLYHLIGVMPTVPGAIGAWRRQALRDIGGITSDTLAEDTDASLAICRSGWRIAYAADARAWTEAPDTLHALWRQRYRWCYGTLQAMWKHRHAVTEGGALGRFVLPYMVLGEIIFPLLALVADVMTVGALRNNNTWLVAVPLFVAIEALFGIYALRLDGECVRPLWALPLRQFVYRQLMYLVLIRSLWTVVRGTRFRWHTMRRSGTAANALQVMPAAMVTALRASTPVSAR